MIINNPLLPKNARQFFIAGPAGKLDTLELAPRPEIALRGIAIIFHPDPKGGGSYTNKIVQSMAKVMVAKGYLVLCPNLRGVGMSEGTHDFGIAEIADGRAVYQYAQHNYPQLAVVLGGFSFGCTIAANLAAQVACHYLILIGPAVTRYAVPVTNPERMLVIHGQDDEIIPLAEVYAWAATYTLPLSIFPQTGHFFHGKLIPLQNYLAQMLNL